jgi:hypothetical protein
MGLLLATVVAGVFFMWLFWKPSRNRELYETIKAQMDKTLSSSLTVGTDHADVATNGRVDSYSDANELAAKKRIVEPTEEIEAWAREEYVRMKAVRDE